MKPVVVDQLHLNLLARVEASECVVEDLHVKPLLLTNIVVAAGAPMLPLANLAAASLLPHSLGVVETL